MKIKEKKSQICKFFSVLKCVGYVSRADLLTRAPWALPPTKETATFLTLFPFKTIFFFLKNFTNPISHSPSSLLISLLLSFCLLPRFLSRFRHTPQPYIHPLLTNPLFSLQKFGQIQRFGPHSVLFSFSFVVFCMVLHWGSCCLLKF